MKNILTAAAIISALTACSTANVQECPEMMCTQEFRMVQVKVTDAQGNPVEVKDFTATNKRTNTPMAQNNEPATINNKGIYTVASDADLKNLSEAGDTILVNATSLSGAKKLSGSFVVSGGKCACHISKISGPETLSF